jgi:hypothetical protein
VSKYHQKKDVFGDEVISCSSLSITMMTLRRTDPFDLNKNKCKGSSAKSLEIIK